MAIHLLYNNALVELPLMEKESVDLIAVDPPYFISNKNKITRKETTDIQMDFGEWDHFENEEQFYRFTERWFYDCMRILKKEGWMYVFFGNTWTWILQTLIRKYSEFDVIQRTTFTWCKSNPAPSYRKYNWRSSTEPALVFSKGMCRIPNFLNQPRMKNYIITPCRSNYGVTGHPTEKPVELMELFVESSSKEGDTVLDNFMGSGTTGMACLQLNRNFIGIENNNMWFTIAKQRLNKFQKEVAEKQGDILLV